MACGCDGSSNSTDALTNSTAISADLSANPTEGFMGTVLADEAALAKKLGICPQCLMVWIIIAAFAFIVLRRR